MPPLARANVPRRPAARPRYHVRAVLGLVAGTVGGCGEPNAPDPGAGGPAFFRAAVTAAAGAGVAGDTYEGTGEFGVNDADGVRRPRTFILNSTATDGRGERNFSLSRQQGSDAGRLARGEYEVALPDPARARWRTLAAVYTRTVDGWMEAYVGRAGTVTVTASTPERVAGTFRFTGVRYYRRPLRGTGREEGLVLGSPGAVPAGQPTLEITGAFAAAPWRTDGVTTSDRRAAVLGARPRGTWQASVALLTRSAAPVAPLLHAGDRVDRLFRRRAFGDPPDDLASLAGGAAADAARAAPLLECAIGVISRPRTEWQGHAFLARVGRQFGGRSHGDRPRAVAARDRNAPDVACIDKPAGADPTAL